MLSAPATCAGWLGAGRCQKTIHLAWSARCRYMHPSFTGLPLVLSGDATRPYDCREGQPRPLRAAAQPSLPLVMEGCRLGALQARRSGRHRGRGGSGVNGGLCYCWASLPECVFKRASSSSPPPAKKKKKKKSWFFVFCFLILEHFVLPAELLQKLARSEILMWA